MDSGTKFQSSVFPAAARGRSNVLIYFSKAANSVRWCFWHFFIGIKFWKQSVISKINFFFFTHDFIARICVETAAVVFSLFKLILGCSKKLIFFFHYSVSEKSVDMKIWQKSGKSPSMSSNRESITLTITATTKQCKCDAYILLTIRFQYKHIDRIPLRFCRNIRQIISTRAWASRVWFITDENQRPSRSHLGWANSRPTIFVAWIRISPKSESKDRKKRMWVKSSIDFQGNNNAGSRKVKYGLRERVNANGSAIHL